MKDEDASIDSGSVGDPTRFRTLAELERGLEALGRAPADRGRVVRVVRRGEAGRRESLERARLSPEAGVVVAEERKRLAVRDQLGDRGLHHRDLHLRARRSPRGLYLRVVAAGELGPGDPVEVVERSPPA